MKFSIIVPVYNAEKYLENTIKQLLQENSGSFEVILVDDGSSDRSPAICDSLQEIYRNKVKVLHQANQGPLAARWNGVQLAQAEYVLFMDADDAFQHGCLEDLQNFAEKYSNPDLIIYSFMYRNPDGTERRAAKISEGEKVFTDKSELYPLFYTSTLLNNVWTKMVKREVFSHCTIDIEKYKSLRNAEDRLLSMEILTRAESVVYTDQPWYKYQLIEDSLTRAYSASSIDRFNDSILYDVSKEYLKQWGMDTSGWMNRLDASFVDKAVYVFDLFYEKGSNKQAVLDYNWKVFLPGNIEDTYRMNPILNDTKKQYMSWIMEKKKGQIDWHLLKKAVRKKLKSIIKRHG